MWKRYRFLSWPYTPENDMKPWWWIAWACLLLPFYVTLIMFACIIYAMANFSVEAGKEMFEEFTN